MKTWFWRIFWRVRAFFCKAYRSPITNKVKFVGKEIVFLGFPTKASHVEYDDTMFYQYNNGPYALEAGFVHATIDNWPPHDPTCDELWDLADMAAKESEPLQVIICCFRNKKYIVPVSSMPKELRPCPVELGKAVVP